MSARPSIPFLLELLRLAMRKEASALYVVPWMPPTLRIDGRTVALSSASFSPEQATRLVLDVLGAEHRAALDRSREIEFDFALDGVGRFRVLAFRRHGQPALTIRPFATALPTPQALALPGAACEAVLAGRGLVVLASASPSLRREAMAALLEHRNRRLEGTLALLDGASRYWHESARSRVQRVAGAADVEALLQRRASSAAPHAALAVAWGELEDGLRLQQAVHAAAEALCLVTLDAEHPLQALQCLATLAAEHEDGPLRRRCALRLHAVLTLRPLPARTGGQLLALTELLPNTPALAAEFAEGDFEALQALLRPAPQAASWPVGATLAGLGPDEHLLELVEQERVSAAHALPCARDRSAFERRLAGLAERASAKAASDADPDAPRVDTAFADLFPTGATPLDPFDFAEPTKAAPPPETQVDELGWNDSAPGAPLPALMPRAPLAPLEPSPRSLQACVWTAPAAAAGSEARVDVWLARAAQAAAVARRAAADGQGEPANDLAEEAVIEEAMPLVTVELRIQDLLKSPVVQRAAWTGQPQRLRFAVAVPAALASGPRAASVRLAVHGLVFGEIGFMLAVHPGADAAAPPEDAHAVRRMVRQAYAVFADADRALVGEVLQPLTQLAPELEVFLGGARLRSGSGWRERIEHELLQRERAFLFWSRAAAESPWVDFEWRCLLRRRGSAGLDIVLLEPPRLAPLPHELADLPLRLWRAADAPRC